MITLSNLKDVLIKCGFTLDKSNPKIYKKYYANFDCFVIVDFKNEKIIYPVDKGFIVNDSTTCNFSKNENFVVLECVVRLLDKGYRPEHIELERKWQLGLDEKGGKADICVRDADGKSMLFIVECKKADKYKEAFDILVNSEKGGQLFSYWQQDKSTKWIVLYTSDYDGSDVVYKNSIIRCTDDANILKFAKKDSSILTYEKASTVEQYHEAWKETYNGDFYGDVIFDEESQAYNIGLKLIKKKALHDFSSDDKIVNKFEEILRHNNISDKENAFNRLIALFICKLADEISKADDDVVDFQYKIGTDTYETLQDRLQKLHQQGMDEFMKEKIFYVSDDYAEKVITQYTGQNRQKLIDELNKTLRILKFYTNNDFSFKDVHNEELFYQNGKVLVEVVQLFQSYRIINSNSLQLLGDLFEQLLNKGFKQNEGQFFTPIPITRFIWKSLPYSSIIHSEDKITYPKIIDYACGAGHFLTEGVEEINNYLGAAGIERDNSQWVADKIFGIEKDYRLARVSKISLFMHGAGGGNIIFGDGLESYKEKNVLNSSFDVLVANPPYSVAAFKPHLKLKENTDFEVLKYISNDGSEIETLFVERISQLLKPNGLGAVVLPNTILSKENNSYVKARESLFKNFDIKAIVQFGSKTFGATGTNTVVVFLKKFNEPPKRLDQIQDSVESIFQGREITEWEDKNIISGYADRIGCKLDFYLDFLKGSLSLSDFESNDYFKQYVEAFKKDATYKNLIKRATFKALNEADQNETIKKKFYEFTYELEKEKVLFFGLTYNQTTAVVLSPNDNKGEERFLGYKWSNRKGQEGIQIFKEGGKLFNPLDANDFDNVSGVVKSSFDSTYVEAPSLGNNYFYATLSDLLDFDSASFRKTIRLVKPRKREGKPGYKIYRLNDKNVFDLSIGNRVLKEELIEEGDIPVVSANSHEVFGYIDKEIFDDYSLDSVLWGIDGDWMVDFIGKNKKFYPTDHCGVMRIKTDEILPKYAMYALLKEGIHERFSRTNRASITAIERLSFQVPSIEKQKEVIKKFDDIDSKIDKYNKEISKQYLDLKSKFDAAFKAGNKKVPLSSVASLVRGLTYPKTLESYEDTPYGVLTADNVTIDGQFELNKIVYLQNNDGFPEEKILKKNDVLICLSSGSKKHVGKSALIPFDTNYYAGGFMGILRASSLNPITLHFALNTDDAKQFFLESSDGSNIQNLSNDIENMKIYSLDSGEEQKLLVEAEKTNELKAQSNSKIDELNAKKARLLDEEFD